MRIMKTVLIGAFVLAALLGGWPAFAESGPASLPEGSCSQVAFQVPEPLWQTGSGCYNQSFCQSDAYCWELCPEANAAVCVNGVCQFTLPGGGSGGGSCPNQGFCAYDYQCVFPGGITGTCINNVCVC